MATDRPVKVLHVFGRLARAGMESRTVELQRFVDRDRFRVDFCSLAAPGAGDLDEEVRALGSAVHYVPLGASLFRHFRSLLRRERYDVVHAHLHYFSGLVVRLAAKEGVPRRVVHFRITSDCQPDTPARRVQRFVMKRWINKYATKILAVNQGSLSLPWDADWRSDPRCQVLYTGIDASRFDGPADRAGVRAEFGLPPDAPLVINVARMHASKNQARLVPVLAELRRLIPGACLLVVGRSDAEIQAAITRSAEALGVAGAVTFAGVRTDVPRLLKASDLLLFPSLHEGLPGAVLEATVAGIPALASDLPGVLEIAPVFETVQHLPLTAADAEWAAAAARLIRDHGGKGGSEEARLRFEQSVFDVRNSAAAHEAVWAGGPAAGRVNALATSAV